MPEFLGQGEGLAVVGCGLRTIRGLTPWRNIAEEAQGICLVAAFLMRTGKRQRVAWPRRVRLRPWPARRRPH